MQAMVFASILTNCVILGFSSEQLMQWLPWLFVRNKEDGDQTAALGEGRSERKGGEEHRRRESDERERERERERRGMS